MSIPFSGLPGSFRPPFNAGGLNRGAEWQNQFSKFNNPGRFDKEGEGPRPFPGFNNPGRFMRGAEWQQRWQNSFPSNAALNSSFQPNSLNYNNLPSYGNNSPNSFYGNNSPNSFYGPHRHHHHHHFFGQQPPWSGAQGFPGFNSGFPGFNPGFPGFNNSPLTGFLSGLGNALGSVAARFLGAPGSLGSLGSLGSSSSPVFDQFKGIINDDDGPGVDVPGVTAPSNALATGADPTSGADALEAAMNGNS